MVICVYVCVFVFMCFHCGYLILSKMVSKTYIREQPNIIVLKIWIVLLSPSSVIFFSFWIYYVSSKYKMLTLHVTRKKKMYHFVLCTAWKVSVFGVFLVHFQSECRKIRARITPITDTFYIVMVMGKRYRIKIGCTSNIHVTNIKKDQGILI